MLSRQLLQLQVEELMRDWEQTEERYNLQIQALRERITRLQEQANGIQLHTFFYSYQQYCSLPYDILKGHIHVYVEDHFEKLQ